MDKLCGSPSHEASAREAIKAFCELAVYFVGAASHGAAPSSAHDNAVKLLAYENMLQILSAVSDEEFPVAPAFRRLAEDARGFVAERNLLLSQALRNIEALAERLGTRVTPMRGSRFLSFYPDEGLRYMKDLDIGVAPGDEAAMLSEAMLREGWESVTVAPGEPPMLSRRAQSRFNEAAIRRLFPDVIEVSGDKVETLLYVELNRQESDPEAAARDAKESATLEALGLAQAEFRACAPTLKHLLDALLAMVWAESPCCGGGPSAERRVREVRAFLRPLGINADGRAYRFDPRTTSSSNHLYRCFADVIAGSPYRAWAAGL